MDGWALRNVLDILATLLRSGSKVKPLSFLGADEMTWRFILCGFVSQWSEKNIFFSVVIFFWFSASVQIYIFHMLHVKLNNYFVKSPLEHASWYACKSDFLFDMSKSVFDSHASKSDSHLVVTKSAFLWRCWLRFKKSMIGHECDALLLSKSLEHAYLFLILR